MLVFTQTFPLDCAAAMSELEAAGMLDFELAGLTEFDTGGWAGVGFAGADAVVLAAGAADGVAAGGLLALASAAVFFLCDFLVVVASPLAAVSVPVAVLSEVLAALVSSAVFFLCDFLVVLAVVSVEAGVCEFAAEVSSVEAAAFFDFLDFFLVVVSVVVLVSLALACAAAIAGAIDSAKVKQKTAIHNFKDFILISQDEADCPNFTNRLLSFVREAG